MAVAVRPDEVVTPSQLEALALYASGYEINEIAVIKRTTYVSVRNNMRRAKERLGAKSLTNLCVILVESGLIARNGTDYKPVQDDRVVGE